MTSPTRPTTYEIESATLQTQPVLVVRGVVTMAQVGEFLGGAFERVSDVARADGIPVSGPPFARLHPEPDGRFAVEAGFPVSGVLLGQGEVRAAHLPGGPALRTTHRGSYERAGDAHEALQEYAAAHGLRPDGDAWEVYLDGPDVRQPRTVVVLPVQAAAVPADPADPADAADAADA
jgi:effector-binding domain-containing protein